MLTSGDLVKIKVPTLDYFNNRLAIVLHLASKQQHYDNDGNLHTTRHYLVNLSGSQADHIFSQHQLELLSKAYEIND